MLSAVEKVHNALVQGPQMGGTHMAPTETVTFLGGLAFRVSSLEANAGVSLVYTFSSISLPSSKIGS